MALNLNSTSPVSLSLSIPDVQWDRAALLSLSSSSRTVVEKAGGESSSKVLLILQIHISRLLESSQNHFKNSTSGRNTYVTSHTTHYYYYYYDPTLIDSDTWTFPSAAVDVTIEPNWTVSWSSSSWVTILVFWYAYDYNLSLELCFDNNDFKLFSNFCFKKQYFFLVKGLILKKWNIWDGVISALRCEEAIHNILH